MCGICGYIDEKLSLETTTEMVAMMKHRGPDHQEARNYPRNDCSLGHARLSIIDLSDAANQPMEYAGLAIVFNGEVYNFKDIRHELEKCGHHFLLDSDTEVILHAYKEWGDKCVDKFVGMFAFAILDTASNELTLFRDRAGVKPLYYYVKDGVFLFASELKAFYKYPAFVKSLDHHAAALYFKYGYVPAPYAIFKNTFKLRAGHILKYNISDRTFRITKYWDVLDYYQQPRLDISYETAKEEMERILRSAFNYRMISDVPVGIFLSGGYDSTGLAAILQADRTERLKTFTIGFPTGTNEAPAAREIAALLGTEHTEYICTEKECKEIIPELPFFFDEPFADNSAVPTILVSRVAGEKVKVALSADGGDETFAGYNRYAGLASVMKYMRLLKGLRGNGMSHVVNTLTEALARPYSFLHEKGETLAAILRTPQAFRTAVATEGGSYSTLAKSVYGKLLRLPYPIPVFMPDERMFGDAISVAMAMDYINYMADDILVKVDRAAMSVSLESREPLIDHRIIEFAARLPLNYKFKDGVQKRIYRDIVYKYIPKQMLDRPKTGFMMPVDGWLRSDLKYLIEEHINDRALDMEIFNATNVLKIKDLFYDSKLGHENKVIWRLLMFQMWKEKNM